MTWPPRTAITSVRWRSREHGWRLLVIIAVGVLMPSCSAALPVASEIPIGGVREPITRENLVAAREGMPGGLLEPSWLPSGFALVNADYMESEGRIASVDLWYRGTEEYLHVWQTSMPAEELGDTDPVRLGEPIPSMDWRANPLAVAQVGRPGVVEYSTRLDDGRTVTVDTDLDRATVFRILEALGLRDAGTD